jgi:hypothetical protein
MGSVLLQQRSCAIRLHGSPDRRQPREPASETRFSDAARRSLSPLRESERSFQLPCRRSGLPNVHLRQELQRERGSGLRLQSSRAALCCSRMSRLPGIHRGLRPIAQQRYSRSLPIGPHQSKLFAPNIPLFSPRRMSCRQRAAPTTSSHPLASAFSIRATQSRSKQAPPRSQGTHMRSGSCSLSRPKER